MAGVFQEGDMADGAAPDFITCVRVLLATRNFEEADKILADGVCRYPQDLETLASYAVAASGQENWPEAAARWEMVLARFPSVRSFHGVAATAYAKAGLVAKADALLELCFAEDEDSIEFRVSYALLADQTGRWTLAAERWGKLAEINPSNAIYAQLRASALWQADLVSGTAAPLTAAAPSAPVAVRDASGQDDMLSLLTKFESLGDNCEFGLLQRHFGAEPATLYRFSAITPERMIEILDLRLDPLGEREHTIAEISGEEYMVRDRRGYFTMHTFVLASQSDEETLLKRQSARITILKRKMLFQLERGDRMFIVKDSSARISDGTLRRTLASLRRYGPNSLLGMRHAEPDHPPGAIERLDDGIWVGYVATMFGCREEVTDYKSWIAILRQASLVMPAATCQGALAERHC